MNRYYFFKPSKFREYDKKDSIIAFDLCALYSEDATYSITGKKAKYFNYFDQISLTTCKVNFNYRFDIDTGINSVKSHYAKSFKDLLKAKKESGYILVSEKNYNSLRLLALSLLFRTVEKRQLLSGDNKFAWINNSYTDSWDFEIANSNFQYNRNGLGSLNDCVVGECFKINVFKNYLKSYKFRLYTYPFALAYPSHDELFGEYLGGYKSKDISEITNLQYARLRKLATKVIFDFSELNISDIKDNQTNSVTIL